jgi:hypothetical protein
VHHKKLLGQKIASFYHAKKKKTPKKKYKYIHLERKNIKKCSKNYVYFMADSKDHYTKKECTSFPQRHPLKGLEIMDYPINKRNPRNLFKSYDKSYLKILIKR